MSSIIDIKENSYAVLLIGFRFAFETDKNDGLICKSDIINYENLDLAEGTNEEMLLDSKLHLESYFKTLMLTLCEKGYDVKYNERDKWFELGLTLNNHSLNEELIRHFIINNIQFYQTNKRKIEFK